eukprot:5463783-Pleurochrysis_carterae.AAC.1
MSRTTQPPSPPTPWSIEQVKEQLNLARNQQSMESNPDMMRQRQIYIMGLEATIGQYRNERRRQRFFASQSSTRYVASLPRVRHVDTETF